MLFDGMPKMSLDIISPSDNKKYSFFSVSASLFVIFVLLFSTLLIFGFTNFASASSYTPAAPSGVDSGDLNTDYEFFVYTIDVGSSWMFDWGDGTYSNWITVGDSDTYVSQKHSWESSGVYDVRVKHRSVYLDESEWSPSLKVLIDFSTDLDKDGYSNDMETAYGTDPDDSDDYPLDTDGDGTPDETPDEGFIGDTDDDGDGLSDELEASLSLDSKDGSDVISVVIGGTTHFIIDLDGNGKSDTFYNSKTSVLTNTKTENGKILLDINNDKKFDYAYDSIEGLTVYEEPFEIPWLYVIVAIVLIALLILFIMVKKGVIYFYEEEYVVEE